MVIAFSLREGGLERLMTTALSMRVSDRLRISAKKYACVKETEALSHLTLLIPALVWPTA